MNNHRNTLAVGLMAKAPKAGKVKTRLAKSIGDENALALYEALLARVHLQIATKQPVNENFSCDTYWFIEPPERIEELSQLYPGYKAYLPQSSGDLGQRMKSALEVLLDQHCSAALIGADIPDITLNHLEQVQIALKSADAVFGPTHDGGYYLIGLRAMQPELFANVPWSADNTLEETLHVCETLSITYVLLEPLADLDTVEDLPQILWRPADTNLRSLFDSPQQ